MTEYHIDGSQIPNVDFNVGESYAGLMSTSSQETGNHELYFWYFPSSNPDSEDEITVWMNGGPGASSLEGLLQENGPFLWQYGTFKPVPNPWTWVNLTNMVWVESPVGTGFTQGKATAISERDIARDFMGFFKNFVDVFDLHKRKIYLTGESYAGMYIPYLADEMLNANDSNYFNLEAIMMYDPLVNSNAVMRQIPAVAFADHWKHLLALNQTSTDRLEDLAKSCGYTAFLEENLVYPPTGPLPSPPGGIDDTEGDCDVWGTIIRAAVIVNPCFDIFQIATTCPLLYDVLGYPGSKPYLPTGAKAYFDRADVKRAINAPQIPWAEASPKKMYNTTTGLSFERENNGFTGLTVLPSVIDRTKRTVIGHAGLDFILLANGTLLTIQNMTWGGQQGFQSSVEDPFFVPPYTSYQESTIAGSGTMGKTHTERGLTFFNLDTSGHMIPQYTPSAAYRSLEFLLGRISSLSSMEPFTASDNGLVAKLQASQYGDR